MVEQRFRKPQVKGSIPFSGSSFRKSRPVLQLVVILPRSHDPLASQWFLLSHDSHDPLARMADAGCSNPDGRCHEHPASGIGIVQMDRENRIISVDTPSAPLLDARTFVKSRS